jgi:hypothetical protein
VTITKPGPQRPEPETIDAEPETAVKAWFAQEHHPAWRTIMAVWFSVAGVVMVLGFWAAFGPKLQAQVRLNGFAAAADLREARAQRPGLRAVKITAGRAGWGLAEEGR